MLGMMRAVWVLTGIVTAGALIALLLGAQIPDKMVSIPMMCGALFAVGPWLLWGRR